MSRKISHEEKIKIIEEIKQHLLNGGYLYELEDPDKAFRIMRSNTDYFKNLVFTKHKKN